MTSKEALQKAQRMCSREEKCRHEVLVKLRDWGVEPGETEGIIEELIKHRFLDESRYAAAYVKDKFRFNNWGKIKISYELKLKRLPDHIIEASLEAIDDEQYTETLRKELLKKFKSINDDDPRTIKAKLVRFATGKGFESNLIWKVVNWMVE